MTPRRFDLPGDWDPDDDEFDEGEEIRYTSPFRKVIKRSMESGKEPLPRHPFAPPEKPPAKQTRSQKSR